MVDDKLKPADAHPAHKAGAPANRFLETDDTRRIILGKLKTDEETRLAAEIEKLRD